MEKISYAGWENCYRLSNGTVELVVTADVGPRIIRFALEGGDNMFKEYADMVGKTGGTEWRIYGGHRLWHAPEAKPRCYSPDNLPVEVTESDGCVHVKQPVEPDTGIEKELDIKLAPQGSRVTVTHRLRNTLPRTLELAPWALTVMGTGAKAIIPHPPRGAQEVNLLPTSTLSLWAYTDMADPRWTWGQKYVMLQQDPSATEPQKLGLMVPEGWAAAARLGNLFVKRFHHDSCAVYPDGGCNVETYTNPDMLELETVGPMAKLEPGCAVEHVEDWFLFEGVASPATDEDIDRDVLPRVAEAKVD
jgi:hypothetical protein